MLESPLRIDPAQPLDPTHPLLRGLEGFWLPLPSTSGGARLYDLSVYGRDGTLTNMDPSTDWVTDPHVQHQGLDFDGTDDWVDLTTELKDVIGGASALAVTHQFKIPDTSSDKRLSSGWNTGDFQETSFAIWMDAGGNGTGYAFQIDLQDDSRSKVGEDNDGAVPGKVEVVTAVFEQGARTEIWKNGSLLSSATPGDSPVVEPPEISLGALGPTAVGDFSDLVLFSTLVHSRAPTSTEMLALHAQARRGFPDLLRTRSTAPLVSTSGGGGTTISTSISDTINWSDNSQQNISITSALSDKLTATDKITAGVVLALSQFDTVDVTDTVTNKLDLDFSRSDTIITTDNVTAALVLALFQSDTTKFTDQTQSTVTVEGNVVDTIQISEEVGNAIITALSVTETYTYTDSISLVGFQTFELPDGRLLVVDRKQRKYTIARSNRKIIPT